MELIGPYLAGCLLLVGAGLAKVLRPADTARALAAVSAGHGATTRRLGPVGARRVVRLGAAAEAGLGLVGLLVLDSAIAGALALSYGAFAAYVVVARRRGGPLATCGCFGTPDTPATRLHVVVNLGLATAALAVAVAVAVARNAGATALTPHVVAGVLRRQPWHGVPLVLAALACAWCLFHVLSTLPRLLAAHQGATGASLMEPTTRR